MRKPEQQAAPASVPDRMAGKPGCNRQAESGRYVQKDCRTRKAVFTLSGERVVRFFCILLLAFCLFACTSPVPGNEVFSRAENAYSSGLYLEAEKLYEEYLQNFPQGDQRWRAWNNLYCIAGMVRNDNDKAMMLLEAMRLEYGGDSKRSCYVLDRQARLHAQNGHWGKAADAWRQVLRLEPVDNATICATILNLGRAYKMQGQYEAVLSLFRENSRAASHENTQEPGGEGGEDDIILPCTDALKYELAQVYTLVENWRNARDTLEDVIENGNQDKEDASVAKFLLADVYINLKQFEKALQLLESIRDVHPNPIAVQANISRVQGEIRKKNQKKNKK